MSVCTVCHDQGERGRACAKCGRQYAPPIPREAKALVDEAAELYRMIAAGQNQLDREWRSGHIKMSPEQLLVFTCSTASQAQLGVNAACCRLLEIFSKLRGVQVEVSLEAMPNVPPPPGGMKH